MTVGNKLNELRARSGLTLGQIAGASDYRGRSSVQKFFNDSYDPAFLDVTVAQRLARALVGRGAPPITEDELISLTGSGATSLERYEYLTLNNVKRDVAVYLAQFALKKKFNTAKIEMPLYLHEPDHPLEYAWHPPALAERSGIYAMLLRGAPLAPRYRPGERIFLSSEAPARIGDDVCLYLDLDGWQGEFDQMEIKAELRLIVFGILDEHTHDHIVVRSLATGERVIFSGERVRMMHPLLTATDMLVS